MARILVVDDALFMRMTTTKFLELLGHEVIGGAENGLEAVSMYIELKPDLVTMDITMPLMNGIDAVRKIIEYDKNAKILMCSAMGQQGMVVEAVQAGAKDFVVKPFDRDRLEAAINKTL